MENINKNIAQIKSASIDRNKTIIRKEASM